MIEKWPGGADDVLTRVPLFARIPGGAAGAVVRAPVSLFYRAGIDVTGDGSGRTASTLASTCRRSCAQGPRPI